jgi:hypothetical protein
MHLVTELLVDDAHSGEVLLALTGRRPLPAGFSVM